MNIGLIGVMLPQRGDYIAFAQVTIKASA